MEPCDYLIRGNCHQNANTPKKFTKPGGKDPMNGCTTGDIRSGSFRELPDPEQPYRRYPVTSDPCLLYKIKYETYIYAELKSDSMAQPKVLIVEDDNVILSIEKWRLSNLGYEICGSAGTGAEAMECVAKMQPDIVLMDITLKGAMDGIEAAGQIKKNFNIPVIFVSSHTDGEIIARAKAVNPDGFIKKPFNDDDLRVAIELGLKK